MTSSWLSLALRWKISANIAPNVEPIQAAVLTSSYNMAKSIQIFFSFIQAARDVNKRLAH